jgi:hypothetical protein
VLDSERTGKHGNGGHKKSTTTVVQVYSECPNLWGSKLNERAQANVCQTSAETFIDIHRFIYSTYCVHVEKAE